MTTPGVISVHRRMQKMAATAVRHLVMEVSSHALDQGRIDGVQLQTAALTNLSRDHLDYHADMEAYKEAKAKLRSRFIPTLSLGKKWILSIVSNLARRI